MNLKNKKILVTGSDGFIGSHLVERLLDENCQIKAFVYYNSFNSWGWLDTFPKDKLKNIEIFAGDIRDPSGVRIAIKEVDVVFHLAALIGIPFSYHSPDSYIDTNIKGTLNVLQSCREYDIERVVIASTSEVYGTAQYVPIDEKHPFQGQSPYSASKIGADKIAESFYRSFSVPVVIARPFNTYGPRMAQDGRVVIEFVQAALVNKPFPIFGDGTQTRSFCYIDDMVNGLVAAMDKGKTGEVYNLGNPDEFTVLELAEKVKGLVNASSEVEFVQDLPEDDPKQRCSDITKAKEKLGWEPKVQLEEGLKKLIDYLQKDHA